MTKLARKFEKIETQLRKRYSFLADVSIDVVEGIGKTKYDDFQKSILVCIDSIRQQYKTPRFVRRFGVQTSFEKFLLVILLHEIAHVQQYQTVSDHILKSAVLEIVPGDVESHDESWVEQEADKWAVKELRKIKKSKSIRI